jgi:hypothetical protein
MHPGDIILINLTTTTTISSSSSSAAAAAAASSSSPSSLLLPFPTGSSLETIDRALELRRDDHDDDDDDDDDGDDDHDDDDDDDHHDNHCFSPFQQAAVLETIDWDRFSFDVMIIELPTRAQLFSGEDEQRLRRSARARNILLRQGYFHAGSLHYNEVWVSQKMLPLVPKSATLVLTPEMFIE